MIVRSGARRLSIDESGNAEATVRCVPGVSVALSLPLYPGWAMVRHIDAPPHAVAREQARCLVHALVGDAGEEVALDCSGMLVGTPSFLDEIVKRVLVEGAAGSLSVHLASPRAQQHLERSATNRGVTERLRFMVAS